MTYPSGTHPQPGPHVGASPPPPPWQPPPPARNRIGWIVAIVAITALLSAALGGILGATLNSKTTASTTQNGAEEASSATATDRHAQDVALCTKYAIINSAIPKPYDNAMDLLPAAAGLQSALDENPQASAAVRTAISNVVSAYYARMAAFGEVRERGLAEPPPSSMEEAQSSYNEAWTTCGLDQ